MRVLPISAALGLALTLGPPAFSSEGRESRPAGEAVAGLQGDSLLRVGHRCRRLLNGQQEVLRGCEALLDELRRQNGGATKLQQAQSRRLAERQERVQWEATSLLDGLRRHDAAVAFVEVVELLLKDMERVRLTLARGAPDRAAVAAARDVVETLRDAIGAFRHSRRAHFDFAPSRAALLAATSTCSFQ
jgi:hypothetical protein